MRKFLYPFGFVLMAVCAVIAYDVPILAVVLAYMAGFVIATALFTGNGRIV